MGRLPSAMKPLKILIRSPDGIEATISSDGSEGGFDDYYAIVSIAGSSEAQKVYGIDPIQSFALAWQLIDQLTAEKRLSETDGTLCGPSWWIEVAQ